MRSATLRALAARWSAIGAVIGTCVASLILLRAELVQVPDLNDGAVHEEMVRFALAKLRSGHFPLDSWFPYLNLGSPQFLHYQSLAALLTALLAWGIGVGHAFTITTWCLVACWPLCVYGASRIFGLRRGAALAAAMLAPFVSSATGVGYEQISYLWSGYGLWSQLFAMWTLPFAWACSWRAIEERRFVVPAAVLVAATAAFHFETGYLAFAAVVTFVVVRPSQLLRRAGRALLVASGALTLSAFAIAPLIAQGKWAAVNQFLQRGPEGVDANSYGANRILTWLIDGDLFDWHHLAFITPLFAVGCVGCLAAWHRSQGQASVGQGVARALVLVFIATLVLFFGRSTLGPIINVLPGAKDLFLRRFIVGPQLAGLFLAGIGTSQLASWTTIGANNVVGVNKIGGTPLGAVIARLPLVLLIALALVPVWSFAIHQDDVDASLISAQSAASRPMTELDALIATIRTLGGGRTFAGNPSDWGSKFTVGTVPVFKYLASQDIDEVGFTLRTASLMSDPEVEFDETNPADYVAFGIRYLLLPNRMQPPVPARALQVRGQYALWEIPSNGYVQVVDTRGSVVSSSANLGAFSAAFFLSLPLVDPIYPTVAYGDNSAAPGTLPTGATAPQPPGQVTYERADLDNGNVSATVSVDRTAVVLLSVSFDPGWQAVVDGKPVPTEMVAPALVGVRVAPGNHTVRFVYRGFPDYPQLLVLGIAGLVVLIGIECRRKQQRSVDRLHKVEERIGDADAHS